MLLPSSSSPPAGTEKFNTLRNRLEARTALPFTTANEHQTCALAVLKQWQKHHFHPLSFGPGSAHPPAVPVAHLTGSPGLLSQSWPAENCSKLRPFYCYWNINKQEVLQGQGTWASDLHISKAKCLLLLLAASGSLQTIYLHLRNSYLVLQTHQQVTLTQKNGLLSSEETMKKLSFSFFFAKCPLKLFWKAFT